MNWRSDRNSKPYDRGLTKDGAVKGAGDLGNRAEDAANYLKALAHEGRLTILCHLVGAERSVTELETLLSSRQAAVSQQLARLRLEGLVRTRRDGKVIYYSLKDHRTERMIGFLYDLFCNDDRIG